LINYQNEALPDEEDLEAEFAELDSSYVRHNFEVYTDREIDRKLMCKLKPVTKKKGVFIEDPFDCLGEITPLEDPDNIYGDGSEQEDLECE